MLAPIVIIVDHFGHLPSRCSAVFNNVVAHLWGTFRGGSEWHPLLNYERIACFAEAISDLLELRNSREPKGFVAREGSVAF